MLADARFRTSDQHSVIDLNTNKRINWPADIVVEDRVWFAENTYVYKGSRIGAGSIVGARSTVSASLPGNSLCLGTPAKAVRSNVSWKDALLSKDGAEIPSED